MGVLFQKYTEITEILNDGYEKMSNTKNLPKIKCDNIGYRKGYIDILPNIHKGLVNIETWNVSSEVDISNRDICDADFPENARQGNTEIEMSIFEAEELISRLNTAIASAKQDNQ